MIVALVEETVPPETFANDTIPREAFANDIALDRFETLPTQVACVVDSECPAIAGPCVMGAVVEAPGVSETDEAKPHNKHRETEEKSTHGMLLRKRM
ncbi:MAG TPA: hypothetical protein VN688_19610 [Gemmataceae bacterium]|nr:hypothetical protein [Gemmataceae bacterium]